MRTSRLQFRKRLRRGMTLMEISVTVTVIAILMTFVVPGFNRVAEQNHVDAASQYLRSIWSAQRVYWLENRTFSDSLATLDAMGLIDPKIAGGSDGYFSYAISSSDASTFTVTATRSGSDVWSGTLQIEQDGEVTGTVSKGDSDSVLTPPSL
jgi:type IV pilus assembly protein PilE